VLISLLTVILVACARHDDFPPMLAVIIPPTPSGFTVTTTDNIVWNLSWTNSDPTSVRIFYVYTLDIFTGAPVLLDSTVATSLQANTSIAAPGIVWGVSAISPDNVESSITFASAD
jgi:hypothetical protein